MIKIHCDRCEQEIKGTSYYTISIYAEDIDPIKSMKSMTTVIQNLNENMGNALGQKRHYCEECKKEIEKFIGRT